MGTRTSKQSSNAARVVGCASDPLALAAARYATADVSPMRLRKRQKNATTSVCWELNSMRLAADWGRVMGYSELTARKIVTSGLPTIRTERRSAVSVKTVPIGIKLPKGPNFSKVTPSACSFHSFWHRRLLALAVLASRIPDRPLQTLWLRGTFRG
jgi:hypothetical protein